MRHQTSKVFKTFEVFFTSPRGSLSRLTIPPFLLILLRDFPDDKREPDNARPTHQSHTRRDSLKLPKRKHALNPSSLVRDPKQVFISHAHEDAEFAHRLANDLQQNGWRVWIVPDSIQPGEKWAEAIERGLSESGVFAAVPTPAAIQSSWMRHETFVAIELEEKGQMRSVPLCGRAVLLYPETI